jgi:gliding motility-associated lipoprotein GldH
MILLSYYRFVRIINAVVAVLILSFATSCEENRIYEKNINIEEYRWDSKTVPSYQVDIKDTSVLYNLYVNVRHAELYPFQNIWLVVGTIYPDGKKASSRVEIMLANNEGKWYGEGLGDIWDYRVQIQENAFFNQPGSYVFTIQQNMRQDPLPGIMAIGLRIENSGLKKAGPATP